MWGGTPWANSESRVGVDVEGYTMVVIPATAAAPHFPFSRASSLPSRRRSPA